MNKIVRESLFESAIQQYDDNIDFVFELNPILSSIGSKEQYFTYINSIFPHSKVKNIVYHLTNDKNISFNEGQIHFYMNKKSLDSVNSMFHGIKRILTTFNYSRDLLNYFKTNPALMNDTWKKNIEHTYNELLDSKNINKFNKKYKSNLTYDEVYKTLSQEVICAILNVKNPYNAVEPINAERVEEIRSRSNNIDAIIGGESWVVNSTAKHDSWGDIEVSSEEEIVVFQPQQVYVLGNTLDVENFKKYLKKNNF